MEAMMRSAHVRPKPEYSRRDFIRVAALAPAGVVVLSRAASLLQCGGVRVRRFDVIPRYVCAGESIQVFWSTNPACSIRLVRDGAVVDETPSAESGEEAFPVESDLDVQLIHDGNIIATKEVKLIRGTREFKFVALGECLDNNPRWAIVLPPQDFSPSVTVNEVQNVTLPARDISVTHAGVTVALPPLASTTDFAGHSPVGDWILTAQPEADEEPWCVRSDGEIRMPPSLAIEILMSCQ
jgi:hypothetical protein